MLMGSTQATRLDPDTTIRNPTNAQMRKQKSTVEALAYNVYYRFDLKRSILGFRLWERKVPILFALQHFGLQFRYHFGDLAAIFIIIWTSKPQLECSHSRSLIGCWSCFFRRRAGPMAFRRRKTRSGAASDLHRERGQVRRRRVRCKESSRAAPKRGQAVALRGALGQPFGRTGHDLRHLLALRRRFYMRRPTAAAASGGGRFSSRPRPSRRRSVMCLRVCGRLGRARPDRNAGFKGLMKPLREAVDRAYCRSAGACSTESAPSPAATVPPAVDPRNTALGCGCKRLQWTCGKRAPGQGAHRGAELGVPEGRGKIPPRAFGKRRRSVYHHRRR